MIIATIVMTMIVIVIIIISNSMRTVIAPGFDRRFLFPGPRPPAQYLFQPLVLAIVYKHSHIYIYICNIYIYIYIYYLYSYVYICSYIILYNLCVCINRCVYRHTRSIRVFLPSSSSSSSSSSSNDNGNSIIIVKAPGPRVQKSLKPLAFC